MFRPKGILGLPFATVMMILTRYEDEENLEVDDTLIDGRGMDPAMLALKFSAI